MTDARWRLTFREGDTEVLPEGTEVEILHGGVLCLRRWSNLYREYIAETLLAPNVWAEVHRVTNGGSDD